MLGIFISFYYSVEDIYRTYKMHGLKDATNVLNRVKKINREKGVELDFK